MAKRKTKKAKQINQLQLYFASEKHMELCRLARHGDRHAANQLWKEFKLKVYTVDELRIINDFLKQGQTVTEAIDNCTTIHEVKTPWAWHLGRVNCLTCRTKYTAQLWVHPKGNEIITKNVRWCPKCNPDIILWGVVPDKFKDAKEIVNNV
jgi:NAD-dependent SIR2 family protein deacetylase